MIARWIATREDGATLELGQPWDLDVDHVVTAFAAYTAADQSNGDQPFAGGEAGGLDHELGRPMSITVRPALDPEDTGYQEAFEELLAFFATSWQWISIAWFVDSVERVRFVRGRGPDDLTDPSQVSGQEVQLRLRALDPRTYGAEVTETIDAAATVAHGGVRETKAWRFTVPGPVFNPVFTAEMADGSVMKIASYVTVEDGHRWEVDGRTGDIRTVEIATGQAFYDFQSVADGGYLAEVQPIAPGTSDCTFSSDTGATTGTLAIRPGY